MLRIGEFSRLCGLSADALYHYEKLRILVPASVDPYTGYRYYDASQLVSVNKILALKDAGFALEEIARLLADDPPAPRVLELLEEKARLLRDALKRESDRLERLHTNIFLIKNGGIPMANSVTIKKVEPILVASLRRRIAKSAFDQSLDSMWPAVNRHIEAGGGKRTIPCLMLYHSGWWDHAEWNIPYDEDNLDVEVAESIVSPLQGGGEVQVYSLPGSDQMASIVHHGPFSTVGETVGLLFEWILQNGCQAQGPIREIYHKGDWATDNPEEYITELQVPIR